MGKLNKNQVGLVVGVFAALMHLVWALLVAIGLGQTVVDWVLPLHFIDMLATILTFSLVNAVILIVMAFIGGYIIGWVFAALWNWLGKVK